MSSGAAASQPAHNARGRHTREEILRAALRVIGQRGVGATTHRAVAEEAGVPVGAPGYYFGTIDGLLQEALRLFTREETDRLRALARSLEELEDPGAEIVADVFARGVAETHVGQATLVVAQFELYLEAARRPPLREAASACLDAYRELAAAALVASGRAATAAPRFVALCDGLGLHQLADPRPDYATAVLKPALVDMLRATE